MLQEPRISAVIPGVEITEQLEENVKGSYERDQATAGLTFKEKRAVCRCTKNYHANLTREYQWLRNWEIL